MTRAVNGNRVVLLETGDEYFPVLEQAFDAAIEEIHLEAYIFADDPTGRRIAEALARAARRGVRVRLLVDGFGAANLRPALRDVLEPAGVSILVFRPEIGRFRLRRNRLRRMHRKLAVIDQRIGFCGGINILDDRDGHGGGTPPRFDYAVRVEGPMVVDMHRAVRRLWNLVAWTRAGRRTSLRMDRCPPQPVYADGLRAAFVVRDNLRNRRTIEEAYLEAITRAEHEVFIANPYFLPGMRLRRALREAVERGVRVRLLMQGKREYFWVHYAIRALHGTLLAAGLEIHEYTASWLHAKVAVIDGRWSTVGSSNIDPFSLLMAREANVVVDDEPFARSLRASLEAAMVAGSVAIRRESLAARAWSDRLLSWIAIGMARIVGGVIGTSSLESE
ncbi:MAG: cardiolipin synthase ClsB [Betaproteobacteria bacterium]